MTKKIRFIITVVIVFCMSLAPFSQNIIVEASKVNLKAVAPTIIGSTIEGETGKKVDVTINLMDNPGITAMVLDIEYDTEIMTLTDVKDGGLMTGGSFITSPTMSKNPYRLIWNIGTRDVIKDGKLVTLTFLLRDNLREGTYKIGISYKEEDIYNTTLENVTFHITDASIVVKDQAVESTDEQPLPSGTTSDTIAKGDVNKNGTVDLEDAQLTLKGALKIIMLTPAQVNASDVDGQTGVALADAQLILKAALKIMNL